jgi:uncharacterized membrane protein
MAHLEVKRKRSSTWWIWLLVLLIVLAVAYYFLRDRIDVNSLLSSGTSASVLVVLRCNGPRNLFNHKI